MARMSDAEARRLVPQLRAALGQFPLSPGDAFAAAFRRSAQLAEVAERDYAAKVAAWERDAPKRAAAEQAMRLAHERRAAQLGTRPGRMPVLAALWSDRPARPEVW